MSGILKTQQRYIIRYSPEGETSFPTAAFVSWAQTQSIDYTEFEEIADTELAYLSLSEENARKLEQAFLQKKNSYLRHLEDSSNFEKQKAAPKGYIITLLNTVCFALFLLEQFAILPSALLFSGQLIYFGIAAITLIPLLIASKHCLAEIADGKNVGLNLLILFVIWSGWLFSLAIVLYPTLFLSLGLAPIFSLPLATISALAIGYYFDASEADKTLKQWCNIANTKIANLVFQHFEKQAGEPKNGEKNYIRFDEIKKNDHIKIEPNRVIPVPGVIVGDPDSKEDECYTIDESVNTGESVDKERKIGDNLLAGSKNNSKKPLYLKASEDGNAILQKRISNFAKFSPKAEKNDPGNYAAFLFVTVLILGITATALLWFFLGPLPVLPYILVQCLSVLTCASPCALAISQLLPIYTSRSFLFKHELFIKDDTLRALRKINMVVFDKTGTLTGDIKVAGDNLTADSLNTNEIFKLLASLEHPHTSDFARSFCTYARTKGVESYYPLAEDKTSSSSPKPRASGGVSGIVIDHQGHERKISFGSYKFVAATVNDKTRIDQEKTSENSRSFVAIDGVYCGWVDFASKNIRQDAKYTIAQLRSLGIKVRMLTGDCQQTAVDKIAKEAGINPEDVFWNIEQAQKTAHLQTWKNEGYCTLMVGDGKNDEGALKEAHVGLSINGAADATEFADGSLRGKLMDIPHLIALSQKIHKQIQVNVWSLLITTTLSMVIAAGISYPILGFLIAPTLASIIGSIIGLIAAGVILYNYFNLKSYLTHLFEAKETPDSVLPLPSKTDRTPSGKLRGDRGTELAPLLTDPSNSSTVTPAPTTSAGAQSYS